MAKDSTRRYPDARAFGDALMDWLQGRAVLPRRRAALWVAGVIGVAALVALAMAPARGRDRKPPPEPLPVPVAAPAEQVLDLLSLIDPARDRVSGSWTLEAGRLRSGPAHPSRIEIPHRPPDEYDLRVEFVRLEGNNDVNVVLSRGGQNFVWLMGGWNNAVMGFETIAGQRSGKNPTTVRRPQVLENGRPATCVISVRKDGLKASLDGQVVAEWKTDYSDLGIAREWTLRDSRHLGLATYGSVAEFLKIEIVERR